MSSLRVLLVALAAACLLTTPAHADQIGVPGDFADLQDAIDAASAGDVIVIDPGTYPPVVVDKSLSLVGHGGTPFIRVALVGEATGCCPQDPAVRLVGPGSGTVTLSNIELGGTTDGALFGGAGQAISGGGFDELRILHCEVSAPTWLGVTGFAQATEAISVSVPWVLVADSIVTGGMGDDDIPGDAGFDVPSGATAILAPSSTVTILDSIVRGGAGTDTFFSTHFPLGCPPTCSDIDGGDGGAGIWADVVQHAGSIIAGGDGGVMRCETSVICTKASGPAIVHASQVMPLPGTLLGSGPLTLGSDWSLTWFSSSPRVLLLVSAASAAPVPVGNKGLLFMASGAFVQVPVPGGGLQDLSLPISADPVFLGFPLVFQVFDAATGLSRPVFASFVME